MTGAADTLIAKGDELINAALSSTSETVASEAGVLWDAISVALLEGVSAEPVIAAMQAAGVDFSDQAIASLTQGLTGSWAEMQAVLTELGVSIPEDLSVAMNGNWAAFEADREQISAIIEAAMTDASKAGGEGAADAVAAGYNESLEKHSESMKQTMKDELDLDTDPSNFTAAESNAETTGGNISTSVGTGMTENSLDAETAAKALVELLGTTYEPVVENSTHTTLLAMGAISTGIRSMSGSTATVTGLMKDQMTAAYQPIASDFPTITKKAMNGVLAAVNAAAGSIDRATGNAMSQALSSAKSIFNYSAGYSIASSLMQGAIDAIRSMASPLSSAARSAFSGAASSMRSTISSAKQSAMGSASPISVELSGAVNQPVMPVPSALDGVSEVNAGIALLAGRMSAATEVAVADALRAFTQDAYLSDPSRGTVYTSRKNVQQTARQTAQSVSEPRDWENEAKVIGTVIAERLIESGVLNRKMFIDKRAVGEEVTDQVSSGIDKKTRQTVVGRAAQGVLT